MRFVVGGTNGWERERSQVPDGVVERTPRALLLLGCMVRVRVLARPFLVGSPALPFIDKGAQVFIDGGKEKILRAQKVL